MLGNHSERYDKLDTKTEQNKNQIISKSKYNIQKCILKKEMNIEFETQDGRKVDREVINRTGKKNLENAKISGTLRIMKLTKLTSMTLKMSRNLVKKGSYIMNFQRNRSTIMTTRHYYPME